MVVTTDFSYTGDIQAYIAPKTGTYTVELWGAMGGLLTSNPSSIPGKGGYVKGDVNLNAGETLYVVVGGNGEGGKSKDGGYNGGGGIGDNSSAQRTSTGGGATHIARESGLLPSFSSKQSQVLAVAGGGGGACYYNIPCNAGVAGGLTGYTGQSSLDSQSTSGGKGGTQTAGGGKGYVTSKIFGEDGSFGTGAGSATSLNTGGGGGSGWYGGGAGAYTGSGGGGSSYTGGLTSNISNLHGNSVVPNPKGGTQTGSSEGYARITLKNAVPNTPTALWVNGRCAPGQTVYFTSNEAVDSDGDTVYYQFQYTTNKGLAWTTMATVSNREYNYTLPKSLTGEYIQFRVRAYDQVEYSDWVSSPEYPILYNTAPSAPTSVYVEGNPSFLTKGETIRINFTGAMDVDYNPLTYYIQYNVDGNGNWTDVGSTPNTYYNWEVNKYQLGNTMQFRVRAYDGSLYSPFKLSANYSLNNKATITLTSPSELVELNEGDTLTISGKVNDPDSNQAVTVYYVVSNSGERVITSSTSGSEFNYSKVLTFKDNALWDGETKVASSLVANGISGEATIRVYAKDTIGAVSETISKTLTLKPNQNPTITVNKTEATIVEGTQVEITAEALDVDTDVVKLEVAIRGIASKHVIDLGTSNGTNPLTTTFKIHSYGSVLYLGEDTLKPLNTGKLSTGIHYLDIIAKDEHGGISDTKTVTINYTANRKPLVTINQPPSKIVVTVGNYVFSGIVTDLDSFDKGKVTFGVKINGAEIISIPLGEDGTFTYDYTFTHTDVGVKKMVFIANDQKETTTITKEFEIVDEKLLFQFKNHLETDINAQKVSVILGYSKGESSVLKVEMCNNAFDEVPTWEDVTESIINGSTYTFTNDTKTAEKWGLNIRIELTKSTSPTVYVDRLGILFE